MPSSIFRDNLLLDKVCLVTGGGTGIGASIARELGAAGATVLIASRKAEHIQPAVEALSAELGRPVQGFSVDIRDQQSVDDLMEQVVQQHGRLDVLVNNGGGQFSAPAAAISPRGWDAVVSTNLTGTWNMTRSAALHGMLEHGGRIINLTMLTQGAFAGMAHSVAARAGVEAMTRTLAVEWAAHNVQINCVAPGIVGSAAITRYPGGKEFVETVRSQIPAKRLARPEEIAWMVAYLASPAGAYITGQVYTVAGGKDLWGDWWPIPDPQDLKPVEVHMEDWEKS